MNKAISRLFLFTICALLISAKAGAQYKVTADTSQHAIPWEPVKAEDILWKKRVWREIDTHSDKNKELSNDHSIPTESMYARILLNGITSDAFKAYADNDTSFVNPLSIDSVKTIIHCVTKEVTPCTYPDQVEYYWMKEDWYFNRQKGQMEVRIDAIAPVAIINGRQKPIFWIRYPDARSYMAGYYAYNGTDTTYYNWDEYFESRQFSSKITYVGGVEKYNKKTGNIEFDNEGNDKTSRRKREKSQAN